MASEGVSTLPDAREIAKTFAENLDEALNKPEWFCWNTPNKIREAVVDAIEKIVLGEREIAAIAIGKALAEGAEMAIRWEGSEKFKQQISKTKIITAKAQARALMKQEAAAIGVALAESAKLYLEKSEKNDAVQNKPH